jgi:hypothetical protein
MRALLRPLLPAVVLVLAVAGCSSDDDASPAPTATVTVTAPPASPSTAPDSPSPSATASPQPTATETGAPLSLGCDELITAQQVYDYNSNVTLVEDYSPAAGSRAQRVIAYGGVACRWVNQSSGDKIDIAVAMPPEIELESLEAEVAATSTATDAFGGDGYFRKDGRLGRSDAFVDGYWLVADSREFFEAGDAVPLVQAALTAVRG